MDQEVKVRMNRLQRDKNKQVKDQQMTMEGMDNKVERIQEIDLGIEKKDQKSKNNQMTMESRKKAMMVVKVTMEGMVMKRNKVMNLVHYRVRMLVILIIVTVNRSKYSQLFTRLKTIQPIHTCNSYTTGAF